MLFRSIDGISRFVGVNYQYSGPTDKPLYTFDVYGQGRFTDLLNLTKTNTSSNSLNIETGTGGIIYKASTGYISVGSFGTNRLSLVFTDNSNYIASFDGSSLTANRIYTLPDQTGTLVTTASLANYVPTSRTLTINGVTYDLSADRTWTVSGGISGTLTSTKIPVANGATSLTDSSITETANYINYTKQLTSDYSAATITTTETYPHKLTYTRITGNTIFYDTYKYSNFNCAISNFSGINDAGITGITSSNIDYIEGTITFLSNNNITTFSFPALKVFTGNLQLNNCPNLTTLDISALKYCGGLNLGDINLTINVGALENSTGNVQLGASGTTPKGNYTLTNLKNISTFFFVNNIRSEEHTSELQSH